MEHSILNQPEGAKYTKGNKIGKNWKEEKRNKEIGSWDRERNRNMKLEQQKA